MRGFFARVQFDADEGGVGDHGCVVGAERAARAEEGEGVFCGEALQLCVERLVGSDSSCDGECGGFSVLCGEGSEGCVAAFDERIAECFLHGCSAVETLLF